MATSAGQSEILTIREVAEYLKVTERTIYRLAAAKKIPASKDGGTRGLSRAESYVWSRQQSALSQSDVGGAGARGDLPVGGRGGGAGPADEAALAVVVRGAGAWGRVARVGGRVAGAVGRRVGGPVAPAIGRARVGRRASVAWRRRVVRGGRRVGGVGFVDRRVAVAARGEGRARREGDEQRGPGARAGRGGAGRTSEACEAGIVHTGEWAPSVRRKSARIFRA